MSVDKRKHSVLSSVSDLETSLSNTSSTSTPEVKSKKQNKKKPKKAKVEDKNTEETIDNTIENMAKNASVEEELKKINKTLSNVISKKDTGFLRELVKDVFLEIKESLMASFTRQIEVIEVDLHTKSLENEKLKTEIKDMKKTLSEKTDEIKRLENKNEYDRLKYEEHANDQEQYSRKSNIRISNLPGDSQNQTSQETTQQVVEFINTQLNLPVSINDIDIAHRLGKLTTGGKPRQIIVKFVRRQTKMDIMSSRKQLKGRKIYVFEDLTKLNNEVLASTRKKQTDEVERSWSVDGKIFVKWKADSSIQKLKFKDYQKWIDLPWPTS